MRAPSYGARPTRRRRTKSAMNCPLDADLARFLVRLRTRLAAGAKTYGDASFTRPAAELVDEVMQEAEDIVGWTFLLWLRLDRLRARVEQIRNGGSSG